MHPTKIEFNDKIRPMIGSNCYKSLKIYIRTFYCEANRESCIDFHTENITVE